MSFHYQGNSGAEVLFAHVDSFSKTLMNQSVSGQLTKTTTIVKGNIAFEVTNAYNGVTFPDQTGDFGDQVWIKETGSGISLDPTALTGQMHSNIVETDQSLENTSHLSLSKHFTVTR